MAEISRPWSGTTVGDAGPYTDDDWTDVWERHLGALADADTGVLSNVGNELVVTGVATPVAVDTGYALVNGTFYHNSASVNVAVPTPAVNPRIDRIVLRKSWAAQTVRIFRIAGIEGGGVPALVQNDGVTWDMPLFQTSITIGGVITLTDERERLFTRLPSMTTAERDAMTPINGMAIYNTTTAAVEFYQGGAWGGADSDFQRITVSGNWVKPARVTFVYVECIGPGGGGGGGEGQAVANARVGGAGGGGGAIARQLFLAASMGALEAVTIGAGGASGPGGVVGDGANGGNGGTTSFSTFLDAFGGGGGEGGGGAVGDGGGGGGTATAAALAVPGAPYYNIAPTGNAMGGTGALGIGHGLGNDGYNAEYGGGGGAGADTGGGPAANDGGSSLQGSPGAGCGGNVTGANVESAGGDGGLSGAYVAGGGAAGGAVGGAAGTAGGAGVDKGGGGGGGGGGNNTGVGGVGGVGGTSGGGGGGGGGGTNTGGAGGVGGRGECRVFSW